jgi:hypothetical protein
MGTSGFERSADSFRIFIWGATTKCYNSGSNPNEGIRSKLGAKFLPFVWMKLLEHRRVAIAEELEKIKG